jgi:hypothetical protein
VVAFPLLINAFNVRYGACFVETMWFDGRFCFVTAVIKHVQCTVCEEVFPDASQLRSHMRSHADDRPFMCAECGNQFTRHGHLRRHMNLHSGNKPFACNMCACQFTRVDHLRRHIKLQHVADDWPEPYPGMAAGGDEIAIKSEVDDDVEADEEVDSTVVEVSAEDCVSRDVRCSSEKFVRYESQFSDKLALVTPIESSSGSDIPLVKEKISFIRCGSTAKNNRLKVADDHKMPRVEKLQHTVC